MSLQTGLDFLKRNFASVGWFLPPYVPLGVLHGLASEIETAATPFTQSHLESILAQIYDPVVMAAMVLHRYPLVPAIQDYKVTIREAIEAHFFGLDHVAAGGLIPVIEGAGRSLARARGINNGYVKDVFSALAVECKNESAQRNMGALDEVAAMMDSFTDFMRDSFFAKSTLYQFDDGTNRHGIAHGSFADADYGRPINFYKTIAAVDFLTFISSFRPYLSWLPPSSTPESLRLATYFDGLRTIRRDRLP